MLELKNISFSVEDAQRTGRDILDGIDLTVGDNQFVVITGPNGGGKSTLAKIIMGIEKPSSGRIYLDGEDITDLSVTERAHRGIAYAFQQPVRFKGLTVSDLVGLAAGKELGRGELCDYLTEVGLCARDYIDRDVNASLSGGEIKRIEIAMALARGAKLTLFDEPEAGIDLWSFNHLIAVFQKLRQKTRGTSLIISHQERILDIADEIVILAAGHIVARGTKDEVLPKLLETGSSVNFCEGMEVRR
ncbi:MAG TPA: ATP-binding cassette domain-containing protein [Candidatus Pygmaiobacter gallistercoris]|nr:ATP-binding cassette domain-containing protein [Candidatus Pygmaiobacter gallistercoris]